MDKELAVNILIAVACCSTSDLHCYECPLWEEDMSICRLWTDEEVVKAVRTLNRRAEDGK